MKIIKPGKHVAMEADFTCEPILEIKCERCDCVFEFTESDCFYSTVRKDTVDSASFYGGLRGTFYYKIHFYHCYDMCCPNCKKANHFEQLEKEQIEKSYGGPRHTVIELDDGLWTKIKEAEKAEKESYM